MSYCDEKENVIQFSLDFLDVELACSWLPGGAGAAERVLTKYIAKLQIKSSLLLFLDMQQFDSLAVIPIFHRESKAIYSSDCLEFQFKFVTLHSCSL